MAFEMTDHIRRRLTDDTLIWLTTVSPKGRPAPRLVWFMWTGQDCIIYSQPEAAKLRHVASNDRVTLNFNSDEHGGDAVVLAGRAELAPDAPPAEDHPGLVGKYADLIKAIGMTPTHFSRSYSVAIRVTLDGAWVVP
ncbi:MAG: TIGR03667 family PPOX class F420-dependent oxidoreductase [Geodermatophilaceae bacterium]|nr:TIGR03667 family PPOX class F420-dependent oxidoreductase [Geodermatophilaceae bacterium]